MEEIEVATWWGHVAGHTAAGKDVKTRGIIESSVGDETIL
jgi:hypothetical protein